MKNVIKFPIENTRKDLLSNKETEDQLRLNKLDFVTEITAHPFLTSV